MPIIIHQHKETCGRSDYTEWLCHVAPDVLWYKIQDWGSYSGQVFGVGEYKRQILFYKDWYGSCLGCGVWGSYDEDAPGGEPQTQEAVLELSKLFTSKEEAKKYLHEDEDTSPYTEEDEKPDYQGFEKAIDEISIILNSK